MSASSYKKAEAVVAAAAADPSLVPVMDEMAESHNVNRAAKKVKAKQKSDSEAQAAAAVSTAGRARMDSVCDLRHCGMEELLANSKGIDCIITDPPYPKEFIPLYGALAKASASVPLVAVMCGQSYLPEILRLMCEHLKYRWTLAYLTPGAALRQWQAKIDCTWKPVLLFGEASEFIFDVFNSEKSEKDHHEWGQSESGMVDLVNRLSKPGQLVCDPFLGGGTTALVALKLGRKFIGCDVDAKAVQTARNRCAALFAK